MRSFPSTAGRAIFLTLLATIVSPVDLRLGELQAAEPPSEQTSPGRISFKKTRLDGAYRAEGIAVGDFNRDGKLDVAAGPLWYKAPDWKPHPIVENPKEYDPNGYSDCFNAWADDLDGDGWTDLIEITWPGKEAVWFQNPQGKPGPWKRHVVTPVASNESPQYVDVDGDGKKDLIAAYASGDPDGPDRRMGVARRTDDPTQPWQIEIVSVMAAPNTQRYSHGLGVGDLNGDGRADLLVTQGWWEQPKQRSDQPWRFHPVDFGQPCADMVVFDFDGDGDADVLSSSAHDRGIWRYENLGDGKWQTHEIDDSFSQSHSLVMADVNGDKLPDFVTGKRFWAHGPQGDVGADEPAVLYWFELTRDGGKPIWTPHLIDRDSGVGTQHQLADVNGDGLLDVVVANKKGVFYFEQVREK